MQSHVDHPAWDSSWANPSEQTIDDLAELGLLRVEPSDNRRRSFSISMKGREVAAEILRRIDEPPSDSKAKNQRGQDLPMTVSSRTLARLAQPFEGGTGPSHSRIEGLWLAEDVAAYLPEEGNKADRVRNGLKALRDGGIDSLGNRLEPNPQALARVASDLAAMLLAQGLVREDDIVEALDAPDKTPSREQSFRSKQTTHVMPTRPDQSAPIFVVHGHDHALLHQVVRVVERATSREVTVLHEQANEGRTILEKFETHAAEAAFAVVLLTADDAGGARGASPKPRGRQNVIFELGFFFGKLGRRRVAVLLADGVEQPSDISGLVYIPIDSAGAWKFALARELTAAGIHVAHDRIP
jgi:predicted nucleotide-binding protein